MSHNIEYRTYGEDVNKDKVKDELDIYVAHADYAEGCSGLYNPIRWLNNEPLNSQDEAEDFLLLNDKKNYDNLAVRYYEIKSDVTSKKLEDLKSKYYDAARKRKELDNPLYIDSVKAAFISCKHCKSKLSRAAMLREKPFATNNCPVCGEDLRPATTIKALNSLGEKIKKLSKQMDEEREKLSKKPSNRKIKWLLKFEYHT